MESEWRSGSHRDRWGEGLFSRARGAQTRYYSYVPVDELPCCMIAFFFAYANVKHVDLSPSSVSEMRNVHRNDPLLEQES